MHKILQSTIETLVDLNEYKDKKVFKEIEIDEEYDNINDVISDEKRLLRNLDYINSIDKTNIKEMKHHLIDSHIVFSRVAWQFEEMQRMINTMIKEYEK